MGSKSSDCPLDVDLRNKLSSVGADLENGMRSWIEGMTGERFSDRSFAKSLKNGVLLCKLANKIRPGICPKIQASAMPFVQMENINSYLTAAKKLGVESSDLFMTVDLFEEKNIGQVIRNLDVLRRITNTGNVKSSPAPVSVAASYSSPAAKSPTAPASPRTFSSSSSSSSSSPSSPSWSSRNSVSSGPALPARSSASPASSTRAPASPALPSRTSSYSSPSSSSPSYSSSSSSYSPVSSPRVPTGVHNPAPKIEPVCPLDKDLKDKLSLVGSGGLEEDVRRWVERVSGERFADRSFAKSLKNGVILCKLANKIRPGICKVQNSPAPFVQMENIGSYLNAARQLGVPASDLFMTVDLYEEKNVGQVIRNLDVLRRITGK